MATCCIAIIRCSIRSWQYRESVESRFLSLRIIFMLFDFRKFFPCFVFQNYLSKVTCWIAAIHCSSENCKCWWSESGQVRLVPYVLYSVHELFWHAYHKCYLRFFSRHLLVALRSKLLQTPAMWRIGGEAASLLTFFYAKYLDLYCDIWKQFYCVLLILFFSETTVRTVAFQFFESLQYWKFPKKQADRVS